jgi:hypothetical protein
MVKLDSSETTGPTVSNHLCDGRGVLEVIFPDEKSRPSLRAFLTWRDQGLFPYLKIGRRVFYNPSEVAWALHKKCTVKGAK